MSTWEIIVAALAHKKPPRNQTWLAGRLGVTDQVVANWKKRGSVPAERFPAIADELEISLEQLYGREPLPWEAGSEWPFETVERERFFALSATERRQVEQAMLDVIGACETRRKHGTMARNPYSIQGTPAPAKAKGKKPSAKGRS